MTSLHDLRAIEVLRTVEPAWEAQRLLDVFRAAVSGSDEGDLLSAATHAFGAAEDALREAQDALDALR